MILCKCVVCNETITEENDSYEHIIPNAIGGMKKVNGFICKTCNNKTGEIWEAELAEQLNPLCLLLGVKRNRGKTPSQNFETVSGEKFTLHADSSISLQKPTFDKEMTETGMNINIQARSMEEARTMLAGIARNYPQVNLDEMMSKMTDKSEYMENLIKMGFTFGGQNANRSIVKSALAVVKDADVDPIKCEKAIAYLRDSTAKPCLGFYFEKDPIINRDEGMPIHCVYIKGDPDKHLLVSYIEYFGMHRAVICLSDSYCGKAFENVYAINPKNGSEIQPNILLDINRDDLADIYEYRKIPDGAMKEAACKVLAKQFQENKKNQEERAIAEAVDYGFKNCGAKEGDTLTDEQVNKFIWLATNKLMPYLRSRMVKQRRE